MLSDSASSLAVQVKSSALITLSIYTPIHIGNLKHKRIKMHRSLVFVSQVILGLQTFLRMCGLPVLVSCRANVLSYVGRVVVKSFGFVRLNVLVRV